MNEKALKCYRILGLAPGSLMADVRRKCGELKQMWDPDNFHEQHKNRRLGRSRDKLTMHPTGCRSFPGTEPLDYIQKKRKSNWRSATYIWRGLSDRRIIEQPLSSIENPPSKDICRPSSCYLKFTGMGCYWSSHAHFGGLQVSPK